VLKEKALLEEQSKERLTSESKQEKVLSVKNEVEICLAKIRECKNFPDSSLIQSYISNFGVQIEQLNRHIVFLETSLERLTKVEEAYSIQSGTNNSA
jgi:CTP:phosphocholine cytidylyltransferase-like protein